MYVCAGVLVYICVNIHGGHGSVWSVSFSYSLSYFETGMSLNLEHTDSIRLAGQEVPKSLPFLPFQCWDNRFTLPSLVLKKQNKTRTLEIWTYFTVSTLTWTISPALLLLFLWGMVSWSPGWLQTLCSWGWPWIPASPVYSLVVIELQE